MQAASCSSLADPLAVPSHGSMSASKVGLLRWSSEWGKWALWPLAINVGEVRGVVAG